jgi:hypothetical protein
MKLKSESDIFKASVTHERLQSAIESVNPDQFLRMLSVVDQGKHKSTIQPLDHDEPKYYWIFKNMDFERWRSASSQILWLSAPRECSIHQVASYVVDKALETQQLVLYFFCSTATKKEPFIITFIHTILSQIVSSSPLNDKISIIRTFLHNLFKMIRKPKRASNQKQMHSKEGESSATIVKRILNDPTDELWDALEAVLADYSKQVLYIVVDGLDKAEHGKVEFIRELHAFIERLQERNLKIKALLTSQPQAEIKEVVDKLLYIEYDKERKGSVVSYVLILD